MHYFKNILFKKQLYYIVENADWSIKHDGTMITSNLNKISSTITIQYRGIKKSIVHFGSINTFLTANSISLPDKSNKIVATWFHIAPKDKKTELIPKALKYVDIWHTSCNLTKKKMIKLGIPRDKIVVVPLGVDLKYFNPTKKKEEIKDELSIPKDKIIIGSFQKDGNGWGEGLEPKLIKAPDVFCDIAERLAKKFDIFVLLTGPARGYVKKRLDLAHIPYRHDYLKNPNEVAKYFQITDLYIVTSREEGGPKSILESMACGTPLISTKVGMAPDVIQNGENGFLVDIDDIDTLYNRACEIIENDNLKNSFIKNGLNTVKKYDWRYIADMYYEKIYKGLM